MNSSNDIRASPKPQKQQGLDLRPFTEKRKTREWERKALHIAVGLVAALLVWEQKNIATLTFAGATLTGLLLSSIERKKRLPLLSPLLDRMERPYDRSIVPGKGLISMMLGAFLVTAFFSKRIAVAAILTLAIGDSMSHIAGHLLKKLWKKQVKKVWQGAIAGTLFATLAASIVMPWMLALCASAVALGIEVKSTSIKPVLLDDNVFVPVIAAFVLKVGILVTGL